jgi:hypothetical protein
MVLSLTQRITELKSQLSSVNNLSKNKTGGDMKFFIFDYNPKEELRIREEIKKIMNANAEIVLFDLYEMMIDEIKQNGYLGTIIDMEREYDKVLLLQEVFQPMLALEKSGNSMLNKFSKTIVDDGSHIVLITGIGKSFPVVRSHTILNNLQSIFKKNPVVMIYPGTFSTRKGHLRLFDRLDDDNYYRAFPISERKED